MNDSFKAASGAVSTMTGSGGPSLGAEHGLFTYKTVAWEKLPGPATGKSLYQIDGQQYNAVEAAIRIYSQGGYQAIWTENGYWWTLMSLVFWEIIFAAVEGAAVDVVEGRKIIPKPRDPRFEKIFLKYIKSHGAPADFMTPEFYDRRKDLIDDHLRELRNRNLERKIISTYSDYHGALCKTIEDWGRYPSQVLLIAVNKLDNEKLLGILERLISNFKDNRFGLPDLMVFSPKDFYFVEVVDDGENLTPEQKEWHEYLGKSLGLRVESLLINRSEEDIEKFQKAHEPTLHEVTISFIHGTGKLSARELDIVRAQDSYFTQDDGIERRHGAVFVINEDKIGAIFELLDLTGGWESQRIIYDDEEISAAQLRDSLKCFRYKAKQEAPLDYCKTNEFNRKPNRFGCRNFNFREMDNDEWLQHGAIDPAAGDWVFDRESIFKSVEKEKYRLRRCPLFKEDKIDLLFDRLPERINPKDDSDWAYIDRQKGLWFWNDAGWLSVYGRARMPEIYEMVGIKKLTANEKSQALHHLQNANESRATSKPLQANSERKKPCLIATTVYGDSEAVPVRILRNFRDNRLERHWPGRLFIGFYNHTSPFAARLIKNCPPACRVIKTLLNLIVRILSPGRF